MSLNRSVTVPEVISATLRVELGELYKTILQYQCLYLLIVVHCSHDPTTTHMTPEPGAAGLVLLCICIVLLVTSGWCLKVKTEFVRLKSNRINKTCQIIKNMYFGTAKMKYLSI